MDENGRRRQGTLAVGLAAALGEGHKNNVISQSLGVAQMKLRERASDCRVVSLSCGESDVDQTDERMREEGGIKWSYAFFE